MKLCDKHFYQGDYVKSVDTIRIESTHERFDLCQSCIEEVRELLNNKEKGLDND